MKLKKILKKVAEFSISFTTSYIITILINANQFKKSCNINYDSLDQVCILKNKIVNYGKQKVHDFKLGCYLGKMVCNLKNLVFDERVYDLTIVINQGIIRLYIPKDVNLIITSKNAPIGNIIKHHTNLSENKKELILNCNIDFGVLIIDTLEEDN